MPPATVHGISSSPSWKQKLGYSHAAPSTDHTSEMASLFAKLSPKPQSSGFRPSLSQDILTKLSDKQKSFLASNSTAPATRKVVNESSRVSSLASAAESSEDAARFDAQKAEAVELHLLKEQLLAANSKIAVQEQELAQTRVMKHTLDQALGPPSEADFGGRDVSEQTISHLQNAFNASNRPFGQFQDAWNGHDDAQSDISDALSAGAYNRARGFWTPPTQQAFGTGMNGGPTDKSFASSLSQPGDPAGQNQSKFWSTAGASPGFSSNGSFQPHRVLSGPSSGISHYDGRFPSDQSRYPQSAGFGARRSTSQAGRGSSFLPPQNAAWGYFPVGTSGNSVGRPPVDTNYQQFGLYPVPTYHSRSAGMSLSPTASEFTSTGSNALTLATSSVSSV